MRRVGWLLLGVALAGTLGACGGKKDNIKSASTEAPARITQIGVNAYLWRSSLDTIGFMPLAQVDSNGGIIITDWYTTQASANERVKVTIAILDTELRAVDHDYARKFGRGLERSRNHHSSGGVLRFARARPH